ncbi:SRPBCC family protein [Streptomyces sp. ID05-04B]|uniref:SRPBCC family protein n=1 Tax=unclassified Streptomyces TaxID=2593676 RepID=UPI000D1996E0|nr:MULTISPECIES: SRPBCC family protein [unclassified Streptomyces]AVV46295.1 MxaD family protein [Streptomyces sp. P3]MDX5568296.1 SRPBCC family protein [Streptomyces sp. ID05-04B]
MPRRLRPEGLDFVRSAPVRLVFAGELSAPPERVFGALAEDVPGWARWFPGVTSAQPLDGGAAREVRLRGGTRFRETVLAAKAAEVYAYRVDVTNAPGVGALVEEWRLAPAGAGTRVRWTFAADGSGVFRAVLRLARPGLGQSFRKAVAGLDRSLAG